MSLLLLFNKFQTEVDDIFVDSRNSEPIQKTARIYAPEITAELIGHFRNNPQAMHSISPRKFEELVAEIFRNQGFEVTLTPLTRDGGFDVMAVRRDDLTGEEVHLIECKRFSPESCVGISVVRGLYGVVEANRATKGIIATTSYFSSEAKNFARDFEARLSLSDYNTLKDWLNTLPLAGRDL